MNLTVQLLDYLPFLLYQDLKNFRLKGDKCHFYKNQNNGEEIWVLTVSSRTVPSMYNPW
jgi:hypothetical protein